MTQAPTIVLLHEIKHGLGYRTTQEAEYKQYALLCVVPCWETGRSIPFTASSSATMSST